MSSLKCNPWLGSCFPVRQRPPFLGKKRSGEGWFPHNGPDPRTKCGGLYCVPPIFFFLHLIFFFFTQFGFVLTHRNRSICRTRKLDQGLVWDCTGDAKCRMVFQTKPFPKTVTTCYFVKGFGSCFFLCVCENVLIWCQTHFYCILFAYKHQKSC